MDIQESSREDSSKFKFLGVIGRAKGLGECIFQTFKEPKIQNFGNQGATFRVYWVYYKPPVLSNSGFGMHDWIWSLRNPSEILQPSRKISLILSSLVRQNLVYQLFYVHTFMYIHYCMFLNFTFSNPILPPCS